MRHFPALAIAFLVLASTIVAQENKPATTFELPRPGADGAISIFNGKDLTGWYGEEGVFSVQDGAIVGKSEKGLKRNEFLKSQFAVSDFRLVLQMKLTPNTENSGIQFRSEPFKGHEMRGYQADAGKGWWGKLYEESARGLLVKEGGEQHVKPEEWNTYEILAIGDRIQAAINGHKVMDFKDAEGRKSGIFGLQVHSGGPVDVRWKDLKLWVKPEDKLITVK